MLRYLQCSLCACHSLLTTVICKHRSLGSVFTSDSAPLLGAVKESPRPVHSDQWAGISDLLCVWLENSSMLKLSLVGAG